MTDFKFGDKTVLRVRMPENEQWAQAVLEETYRNYTGNSRLVGDLNQISSDPSVNAGPPAVVEGIIDASGSMKEEVNGECKLDIAKVMMLNTINRMLAHPVGARTTFLLRVMGHTSHPVPECQETELLVEPGRLREINHYRNLVDKILNLTASGRTPITYTFLKARDDLHGKYAYLPGTRHYFMISDEAETQCMRTDCLGRLLPPNDSKDIVSIGLDGNMRAQSQLAAIATPGRYRNTEQMAENAKGVPAVQNAMGTQKSGKYVFPSPDEFYGQLQATTKLEGKVILPKKNAHGY
jgi:hypothetical protein